MAYCPCRQTASPQTQRTAARQQANRCRQLEYRRNGVLTTECKGLIFKTNFAF